VEAKLDSVLRALGDRADADAIRMREVEEHRDQLRRAEREQQHRLEHQRIEQDRADRLRSEITDWRWASEIRDYTHQLLQRLPTLEEEDAGRIEAWCRWADTYADQTDPLCHL